MKSLFALVVIGCIVLVQCQSRRSTGRPGGSSSPGGSTAAGGSSAGGASSAPGGSSAGGASSAPGGSSAPVGSTTAGGEGGTRKPDPEGNFVAQILLDICAKKLLLLESDKQAIMTSLPQALKEPSGAPWAAFKNYVSDVKKGSIKIDAKLVDKVTKQLIPCFANNAAKGLKE